MRLFNVEEVEEAKAQVVRLFDGLLLRLRLQAEALSRYAAHDHDCQKKRHGRLPCDCGLAEFVDD